MYQAANQVSAQKFMRPASVEDCFLFGEDMSGSMRSITCVDQSEASILTWRLDDVLLIYLWCCCTDLLQPLDLSDNCHNREWSGVITPV